MSLHSSLADTPLPVSLLDPQSTLRIAARTCLLEGPAYDSHGNLFFSDIIGNQIYRMAADGVISVFRSDSGRTNGNTFDGQGRLISCEGAEFGDGGRRRLVRTDMSTGSIEVLTDDVVVDNEGRIWFTDPFYGSDRSALELDDEAVYRIDTNGVVSRVVAQPQIERPNGLAITPDGRTLYVIDSHTRPGGNRKVWSFDVGDDGQLGSQRLVFDFGRGRGGDGMRLDAQGNLWVAAGILYPRHAGETADVPAGIYVITPAGKLLGHIPIPEDVCTNLTFGGPHLSTLFVTAGKSIFKIALAVSGYSLYPNRQEAK
jgi:gluconolactonase